MGFIGNWQHLEIVLFIIIINSRYNNYNSYNILCIEIMP